MDVASASSANGTAIQLYDCNGTSAQTWQFRADGTIRPIAAQTLCLAAASAANAAQIILAACNGDPLQKWTW